jgi:hypothetical protein
MYVDVVVHNCRCMYVDVVVHNCRCMCVLMYVDVDVWCRWQVDGGGLGMGQALPNLKIIIMLVCWFSHLLCYSVVKYYVHRIQTLSSSASMAVRPLQKSEFAGHSGPLFEKKGWTSTLHLVGSQQCLQQWQR